ncbi:MAG TPA: hypothetical protein VFY04_09825 [Solirubrobacterales bacterium]|nr:hypothetical protein [Solirubrobacterales bacterium]
MAAVLGCGRDAALSYGSAAALWGFERERRRAIEVSVGGRLVQGWEGVLVYRRFNLTPAEVVRKEGIQVTSVVRTLIDVASALEILRWRGPSTRSTDSA